MACIQRGRGVFWVTFLTIHSCCRLMMSCYVPLSCFLSPRRWNVYGGICQRAPTAALRLAVLLLYSPAHCLVTNAGFILVKWKGCSFIIFNTIFMCNSVACADAVWKGSDWWLHVSSDFCWKSVDITWDRCNVNWNNKRNNSRSLD